MKYVNNAWSSKMLQQDLAVAQITISKKEFIEQARNPKTKCVIGHPDTAKLFGLKENRQTLVLEPGDVVYVCELNDSTRGRLPVGITQLSEIPEGFFRFLKCIVFEIPKNIMEDIEW